MPGLRAQTRERSLQPVHGDLTVASAGLQVLPTAGAPQGEPVDLRESTLRVQQDLAALEILDKQIERAAQEEQEALVYRPDQSILTTFQGVDQLLSDVSALPNENRERSQTLEKVLPP